MASCRATFSKCSIKLACSDTARDESGLTDLEAGRGDGGIVALLGLANSSFHLLLLPTRFCSVDGHRGPCGDYIEPCLRVLRTMAACQSMPAAQVPEQLRLLVTDMSYAACIGHYDIACAGPAVNSRWLDKPFGIKWLESL